MECLTCHCRSLEHGVIPPGQQAGHADSEAVTMRRMCFTSPMLPPQVVQTSSRASARSPRSPVLQRAAGGDDGREPDSCVPHDEQGKSAGAQRASDPRVSVHSGHNRYEGKVEELHNLLRAFPCHHFASCWSASPFRKSDAKAAPTREECARGNARVRGASSRSLL
eukprot:757080-Hanusia_phi.AAC.2